MNVKTRQIDEKGRITIPKEYLERMGINEYHDLFIYQKEDRIIISHNFHPEFSSSPGGERGFKRSSPTRRTGESSTRRKGEIPDPIPVKKFEKSEKYNPEWAVNMKEKGYSVLQLCDVIEKDLGIRPNRSTLTKWIKEYREG